MIKRREGHNIEGRLWTVRAKLYAIGELIKFRGGEASICEEDVCYGLGEILTNLSEELDSLLEDRNE